MIGFVLILLFVAVVLFSLISGLTIFYHFKRFGLVEDPNRKKILKIFIIGGFILIFLSLLFLILNLFQV